MGQGEVGEKTEKSTNFGVGGKMVFFSRESFFGKGGMIESTVSFDVKV